MPSRRFFIILCVILLVGAGLFWYSRTQKAPPTKAEQAEQIRVSMTKSIRDTLLQNDTSTTTLMTKALFADEQLQSGSFENVQKAKDQITQEIGNAQTEMLSDRYTAADLIITNKNTDQDLRNYGNSLGYVLKHSGDLIRKPKLSELQIIKAGIGDGDTTAFAELDQYIAYYKKTINDMLGIQTPSEVASAHLALVNGYASILAVDIGFRNVYDNVSPAAASLYAYPEALKKYIEGLTDEKTFFEKKNIIFSIQEDGYFLTHLI